MRVGGRVRHRRGGGRARPSMRSSAAGGHAMAVAIRVEDADAVDAAFGAVEAELGRGRGPGEQRRRHRRRARDADDRRRVARVLAVDLTGAFHTIRRATPKMMRARFGRIVNVSSVVAHVGGAGQANYGAAKAGTGRAQPVGGPGARRPWHHLQRGGARPDRHRDDRGHGTGVARDGGRARAGGPGRHPRGMRRGDRLPRLGRGRLRERAPWFPSTAAWEWVPEQPPLQAAVGYNWTPTPPEAAGGADEMERDEALTAIREVAVEVLSVQPEAVVETARFAEDLDADSLDLVELVMGLEERFDVSIPEEDLEGVATVGNAVDLVLAKASPAHDASDAEGPR